MTEAWLYRLRAPFDPYAAPVGPADTVDLWLRSEVAAGLRQIEEAVGDRIRVALDAGPPVALVVHGGPHETRAVARRLAGSGPFAVFDPSAGAWYDPLDESTWDVLDDTGL